MNEPGPEHYSPLGLIAVILGSLVLFSVFFLGFLVAPLAVLILFYVFFAATDRSRRNDKRRKDAELPGPDTHDITTADEGLAAAAAARRAQGPPDSGPMAD